MPLRVRTNLFCTFLLSLFVFLPEIARANLDPLCRIALETANGALNPTGAERLALAQRMKAANPSGDRKEESKVIQIAGVDATKMKEILKFLGDNSKESRTHQNSEALKSPLSADNPLHLNDHINLLDGFRTAYESLGIDYLSLLAITRRHDIGKEILDPVLDNEIKTLVEEEEKDPKLQFLKRYVMAHDEHTFTYGLAKDVIEVGKRFGLNEDQKIDLYRQLLQGIVYHNFGPFQADPNLPKAQAIALLSSRYPDLNPKEIESIYGAFWPKFYGNGIPKPDGSGYFVKSYAQNLGIDRQHGQPQGALANALALNDRITLVTEGALNKIPNQNLGRFGFKRDLIFQTFLGADAIGINSEAIIKAQHQELMRAAGKNLKYEEFEPTAYGLSISQKVTAFGEKLLEMNSDDKLSKYKIDPLEATHTILVESSLSGVKQMYKVTGADLKNPKVSVWKSENGQAGKWVDSPFPPPSILSQQKELEMGKPDPRTPWDLVMDLARGGKTIVPTPMFWQIRSSQH